MQIITGYTGTPHITSAQDRAENMGTFGTGSYILNVGSKLAATVQSSTEVRISDGVVSNQGCLGIIESGSYDSLTITPGTSGMQRRDYIVARYIRDAETNVESLTLMVLEGTPASSSPANPSYYSGSIAGGDSPVDAILYRINYNGVNTPTITQMASSVRTQAETDSLIGTSSISNVKSTITGAIGNTALGTTATTLSGAIAEHEGDISTLNSKFSQTRTQPNIYQSRATGLSGGYIKIGNLVIVTLQFSAGADFAGQQAYLSGMPVPIISRGALSVYGQATTPPHMQAHVTESGYLTLSGSITNNETISVAGAYIAST